MEKSGIITALSEVGQATVELLALNLRAKVDFREVMIARGLYE